MTDHADKLLEESLSLPPKQRAKLAHRLIVSLEDAEPDDDAATLWVAEIERRAREIDDGTAELLSWERVREHISKHLKAK
jgi:putative addiction module component (TIGR02574 family)